MFSLCEMRPSPEPPHDARGQKLPTAHARERQGVRSGLADPGLRRGISVSFFLPSVAAGRGAPPTVSATHPYTQAWLQSSPQRAIPSSSHTPLAPAT